MKTRNGFVSNSSSSSFIAVCYKAEKKVSKPSDFRKLCEDKFSKRVIQKYALDFFTEEDEVTLDDFDQFPVLFWKEMWKDKKASRNSNYDRYSMDNRDYEEYEVPKGLELLDEKIGPGVVGKLISGGSDVIVVDADKLAAIIQAVKQEAPSGVKIEVVGGTEYN